MQDTRETSARKHDILNGAVMAVILTVGMVDIIRYIILGAAVIAAASFGLIS